MKGSLVVVGFFVMGCLSGWSGFLPGALLENDFTIYVLYLLMFQVGISIGSDKKLKEIFRTIRPKLLLVPLATITGTLIASTLVSLVITTWSVYDCLAVGSGFAYYSLSSILITEFKEPSLGAQMAAELGTVALIANIIREIFALLGAPLFVRYFGKLAPICAGGATTMDTTLPVITRYSGKDMVFIAILHGILVDLSVPFFLSRFSVLFNVPGYTIAVAFFNRLHGSGKRVHPFQQTGASFCGEWRTCFYPVPAGMNGRADEK